MNFKTFKLLAEGRLNAADADLNALPNVYYPIIKILRQEHSVYREYRINGSIKIYDGDNNELLNLPIQDFVDRSKELFNQLIQIKGSSFAFTDIETFLRSIDINTLTATKTDKSDIKIVVHDLNTGTKPKLGFSIKSMLGENSTLFNAGNTTNFIYELIGNGDLDIEEINAISNKPMISNRISAIKEKNYEIKFTNIQSSTLQLNLQLIDSDLPRILAELLLLKYTTSGITTIVSMVDRLKINNPLGFDLSQGHPFYEYKIKNFLTDSALGMTPAVTWTGIYDASGGMIIVKEDGELVCYHIYNRNEFQDYLLKNTRLEQASTSRYNFGTVYQENDKFYIKLNLQIRFVK